MRQVSLLSLTAVHRLGDRYVGKQTVALKEISTGYWLKELQETMDRLTGRRDITEIMLKTALNTIHSINHSNRDKGSNSIKQLRKKSKR